MLELSGRVAERVTLAVGADPDRVAWALDVDAQGRGRRRPRPRRDLVRCVRQRRLPSRSRRRARSLISGARRRVRTLLVDAGIDRRRAWPKPIGGRRRGRPALRQQRAPPQQRRRTPRRSNPSSSTGSRSSGRPHVCAERLRELAALGIDRFVITGASFGADRDHARTSNQLLTHELLPELHEGASA